MCNHRAQHRVELRVEVPTVEDPVPALTVPRQIYSLTVLLPSASEPTLLSAS